MTMNPWLFSAALIAATSLIACGGSKDDGGEKADEPAAAAAAEKAPDTPAAPAEPTEKAVAYSKEAMAKQLEQVNGCEYDFNCDALKDVIAMGAAGSEDVIAFVEDTTKNAKGRKVALKALTETKAHGTAQRILAIARKTDGSDKRDYYAAVGALANGDKALFDAVKADYMSVEGTKRIPISKALEGMPALSMAWATADFGTDPKHEVMLSTLVNKVAAANDLEAIKGMLAKATDMMAKHRLAATAIALGDKSHFGVFVAGLESKDQFDRSDAANFLAKVAKDAPAELQPKLVELLKAGLAGDQGGLTARGYKKSLEALGAK